jgi:uncharacterized NAD(P)/FAD-binding protein YdhS
LNLIDDEAIDVLTDANSALVLLASGEVLPSHRVVLAFGNFLPPDVPTENQDYAESEKYFRNAWDELIPEKIAPDDEITIIGTGLSAVDAILTLHQRNHASKITAISKHGWFPAAHSAAAPYQPLCDELERQTTTRDILKTVRRHCSRAENWRGVIDALRPATQKTWLRLPTNEKKKFLRHLRRIWDVSRHRMPPQCAEILQNMQNEGRLEIRRGKIRNIEIVGGKFAVEYVSDGAEKSFSADAIINCIGAESNFGKIDFPLVKSLIERGEIVPDELALGLAATPTEKLSAAKTYLRAFCARSARLCEAFCGNRRQCRKFGRKRGRCRSVCSTLRKIRTGKFNVYLRADRALRRHCFVNIGASRRLLIFSVIIAAFCDKNNTCRICKICGIRRIRTIHFAN